MEKLKQDLLEKDKLILKQQEIISRTKEEEYCFPIEMQPVKESCNNPLIFLHRAKCKLLLL
jgi:hypothetical protein